MREIKFRFWSKILNNFVTPDDDIFVGALKDKNMVVTQYVGLKDKHGKEIYEGDIIETWVVGDMTHEKRLRRCLVKFNHGEFRLKFPGSSMLRRLANRSLEKNTEVIGNIFENKELLKK